MNQFIISQEVFWVEKEASIQIVKGSDPRIFKLEGIAADVFLAISQKKSLNNPDEKLIQKVLIDLLELGFITK